MNAQVLPLFPDLPVEQCTLTPGQIYARFWAQYTQVMKEYHGKLNDLRDRELAEFGMPTYLQAFRGIDKYDQAKPMEKVADALWDALVRFAESQFAPAQARLSIDREALAALFPKDPDKLDPEGMWAWLTQTYQGQNGETQAWQQAAARLVEAFHLKDDKPVIQKAGYVLLEKYVHTEVWSSRRTLSVSSAQSIHQAVSALADFATWAEMHGLARDLWQYLQEVNHSLQVISREKFGWGKDGKDIVLTTFHSSFEFRIKADLAERMQVFIGTYLQP